MEYHFYSNSSQTESRVNAKRIALYFLPVFALAVILPVLVGLVSRPTTTDFSASAKETRLSAWIEPANVEVTRGTPVSLSVIAFYESEGESLTGVTIPVNVTPGASIENATVEYKKQFIGQVFVGTVIVTPQTAGTVTVSINPDNVTTLSSVRPQVTTSNTFITVR